MPIDAYIFISVIMVVFFYFFVTEFASIIKILGTLSVENLRSLFLGSVVMVIAVVICLLGLLFFLVTSWSYFHKTPEMPHEDRIRQSAVYDRASDPSLSGRASARSFCLLEIFSFVSHVLIECSCVMGYSVRI